MARVVLIRRAIDGPSAVDLRKFCVVYNYFLSYNGIGPLYGNNVVSLYQLSSVCIRRNWADHQLLLHHGLQVSKLK